MPNIRQFKKQKAIFSDLKRIMMVKEIQRNGVSWCFEIAPDDL